MVSIWCCKAATRRPGARRDGTGTPAPYPREIVWQALRKFVANKAEVADRPIERCGHAAGCKYTATFVLNAIKTTGMKRLA